MNKFVFVKNAKVSRYSTKKIILNCSLGDQLINPICVANRATCTQISNITSSVTFNCKSTGIFSGTCTASAACIVP